MCSESWSWESQWREIVSIEGSAEKQGVKDHLLDKEGQKGYWQHLIYFLCLLYPPAPSRLNQDRLTRSSSSTPPVSTFNKSFYTMSAILKDIPPPHISSPLQHFAGTIPFVSLLSILLDSSTTPFLLALSFAIAGETVPVLSPLLFPSVRVQTVFPGIAAIHLHFF